MWLANALVARQQQAPGVLAASEPPPDSLRRLSAGGGSAGNSSGVANGARRRFPRNSTFLLSRHFNTGSVSLTNVTIDETQALDFCGSGAVEGCNCCCANSLRGPGSFMDSVNACDAAFCESEFHYSNCSALYTSVTSDGVPVPLDDRPMATPQPTEPPPSGTSDGVPVPDGHFSPSGQDGCTVHVGPSDVSDGSDPTGFCFSVAGAAGDVTMECSSDSTAHPCCTAGSTWTVSSGGTKCGSLEGDATTISGVTVICSATGGGCEGIRDGHQFGSVGGGSSSSSSNTGANTVPAVTFSLTIAGSVDDFEATAFRTSVAAALNTSSHPISVDDVELHVDGLSSRRLRGQQLLLQQAHAKRTQWPSVGHDAESSRRTTLSWLLPPQSRTPDLAATGAASLLAETTRVRAKRARTSPVRMMVRRLREWLGGGAHHPAHHVQLISYAGVDSSFDVSVLIVFDEGRASQVEDVQAALTTLLTNSTATQRDAAFGVTIVSAGSPSLISLTRDPCEDACPSDSCSSDDPACTECLACLNDNPTAVINAPLSDTSSSNSSGGAQASTAPSSPPSSAPSTSPASPASPASSPTSVGAAADDASAADDAPSLSPAVTSDASPAASPPSAPGLDVTSSITSSGGDSGNDGCFAASTVVCRLRASASLDAAPAAYESCFGDGQSLVAELVEMRLLVAGDRVLSSDGRRAFATVVLVTQHRSGLLAPLLTLRHGGGALRLTPDHALWIDGQLQAASAALAGSTLTGGEGNELLVKQAAAAPAGLVINPVTAAGTLLAAGAPGEDAVLAATHPAWIAPRMLGNDATAPFPLLRAAAAARPEEAQASYDALERAGVLRVAALGGPGAPMLIRLVAGPILVGVDVVGAATFGASCLASGWGCGAGGGAAAAVGSIATTVLLWKRRRR